MAISETLKALLRRFGEIQATAFFYGNAQLPGPVEFAGKNYSLCDLEPGEPALIVGISTDGSSRIEPAIDPEGRESDVVKVMTLPENEFWYFEAFRPALSRLSLGAPGFLFEMELVTLYGVFEAFLSDTLRDYFRLHLQHLGPKAQRELEALGLPSNRIIAAVNQVIDREVRRLTYNSVASVLAHMRAFLDMQALTSLYDTQVQIVALVRNCLLHGGGRVDQRLAAADPVYTVGQSVSLSKQDVSRTTKSLRDLAYAIDQQVVRPASTAP